MEMLETLDFCVGDLPACPPPSQGETPGRRVILIILAQGHKKQKPLGLLIINH